MDKDPRVIGARIARRRHQLDWSQVELARRLGVSPSTVANWERGVSYPKKKWGKVEQALGISLDGEPEQRPVIPPRLLAAIENDDELTDEQRRSVIAAIEEQLSKERGLPGTGSSSQAQAEQRQRPAS